MRRAVAALALLGGTAASAPGFRPGLWELASAPTAATLDGRSLGELPYEAPPPERVCLTGLDAAKPAAWLARGMPGECTPTRQKLTRGKVDIAAACAPKPRDLRAGTMRLTGTWSPDRYDLRFSTISHGENGTMGFDGTMTGKRLGDCPAT